MKTRRRLLKGAVALCLLGGAWFACSAAWITTKAYASSILIENAWQDTLASGNIARPWPWADMWPVARLVIPAIELDEIVLSGDSGATLAFAPGLSPAGSGLDRPGVDLISAHRDTHFRQLQHIARGHVIHVTTPRSHRRFRVYHVEVVDSTDLTVARPDDAGLLLLATCYPFDALRPGGKQRFVVLASETRGGSL